MSRDVVSARLHLPQIRVLGVVEDTSGALVVEIESAVRRLRCPGCGSPLRQGSMTAAPGRSRLWRCRGGVRRWRGSAVALIAEYGLGVTYEETRQVRAEFPLNWFWLKSDEMDRDGLPRARGSDRRLDGGDQRVVASVVGVLSGLLMPFLSSSSCRVAR